MNITVTGSTGNISKPLTETLVKAGHNVTVISSNADKADSIKALGATPAIGSITDVDLLTKTFTGADAAYVMIPPNIGVSEWKKYIASIGQHYADAIKASGLKKVVFLSSIGAHLEDGTGPITGIHRAEEILKKLDGVDIKFLRPAYFYTNYFASIGLIKHAGIIGDNYSADTPVILVHPNDIADAAAEELQNGFTGKSVRYITSEETTAGQVAKTLGAAIGKPELPWVEFSDADNTAGMIGAGLPEEIAVNYTEMGAAIRTGILFEDYNKHKPALGKISLAEFAKEWAIAFNA